jgi:hypothetical protein
MLMQEGRPLFFTDNKLCDKHLGKLTYEKKMMVIIHAVIMWHRYLMGNHFQIKTYHHSLKYFLE